MAGFELDAAQLASLREGLEPTRCAALVLCMRPEKSRDALCQQTSYCEPPGQAPVSAAGWRLQQLQLQ